jgi:hypothetical protein
MGVRPIREDDRDRVSRQGTEAWKRLKREKNWNDWLKVGEALQVGREWAMHQAMTNKPEGKAYNTALGEYLVKWKLDDMDKGDRSRLFTVLENLPMIEEWRSTLTITERPKLNHPNAVLRKWKAHIEPEQPKSDKPTLRDSVVNLSEEVAAKDKEIADLKAHIDDLEAARGDGGVAATTNPLKALDAGAIVDLILQLKKSTVAAIVHDLTKETKAATEPKSEEPKATPTLKWKDLDARKRKMPIERHHFEAKTPTASYGISMQGKGVGGLDFAGHNVHFRQGNGSPERIGHAGTLEQAKEIAQEHAISS